jgi:hypothetical protein
VVFLPYVTLVFGLLFGYTQLAVDTGGKFEESFTSMTGPSFFSTRPLLMTRLGLFIAFWSKGFLHGN